MKWKYIKYIIICVFTIIMVIFIIFLLRTNSSTEQMTKWSNILLTASTAFYTFITFILLVTQDISNEKNLELIKKQNEISIMPLFFATIKKQNGLQIEVSNVGHLPAYDVNVIVSGCFEKEKVRHFIVNSDRSSKIEDIKRLNKIDDDDCVYLLDRVWYPLFLQGKKVNFEVTFPEITDSYTIYIKYCSINGDYYTNEFWLIDDTDGKRKHYQLASFERSASVQQKNRLGAIQNSYPFGILFDNAKITEKNNFTFVTGVIEDRGEWIDTNVD